MGHCSGAHEPFCIAPPSFSEVLDTPWEASSSVLPPPRLFVVITCWICGGRWDDGRTRLPCFCTFHCLPASFCCVKCRPPPCVHPSTHGGVGVDCKWLADRQENQQTPVPSCHMIPHVMACPHSNSRKGVTGLWPSPVTNQILSILPFSKFLGLG